MLRKIIQIGALSAVLCGANVPFANAQTVTLLNTSSSTVNNLLNVGTSTINGYVSGAAFTANFSGFTATVGFTGASGIVHGANIGWTANGQNGGAWAPAVGGVAITSNYFVAARGMVTLNLSTNVNSFQFLWGSPGGGDVVSLYSGGTLVGRVTGAQVNAANTSFNNAVGTTVITNLQTTGGVTFDTVAISNPTSNFEFALQTTQATPATGPSTGTGSGSGAGGGVVIGGLPSPAPSPILGATLIGNFAALLGLFSVWRKKYSRKLKALVAA